VKPSTFCSATKPRGSLLTFRLNAVWDRSVRSSNTDGGKWFFSSPKRPVRFWGPPGLVFNVYWSPFPWGKAVGPEVSQSTCSSVKVKHEWSYTSIPLICFHGRDREGFGFALVH
jgi:hypothetical protein